MGLPFKSKGLHALYSIDRRPRAGGRLRARPFRRGRREKGPRTHELERNKKSAAGGSVLHPSDEVEEGCSGLKLRKLRGVHGTQQSRREGKMLVPGLLARIRVRGSKSAGESGGLKIAGEARCPQKSVRGEDRLAVAS